MSPLKNDQVSAKKFYVDLNMTVGYRNILDCYEVV